MCGIVGVVDFKGLDNTKIAGNKIRAMARLEPRGPDGHGTWADSTTWFGHRRLRVVDPSDGGRQPMVRGDWVVTYNGEIYNFESLRTDLEKLGHRFQSRSDTEVLLAGWQAWGPGLLNRLQGMFAFGVWNKATRELILARDRFGKKPLFYRHEPNRVAFGSDLVALGHLWPEHLSLDHDALRLFFSLRFIPQPWSILKQIRKLPPGHMALVRDGRIDIRPWYGPGEIEVPPDISEREAAINLRDLFDQAVGDRLTADVPVGAFLSGGLDSASVVAALAARGGTVGAVTIGFAGASDYYEERPAARAIAKHLGIEHMEVEVGPGAARDVVDDVFKASDEPFADSSALPQFLLCRETRNQFTVALSGDGADEVFGGYRKYQAELWAGAYRSIPKSLRRFLIEPLASCFPEGKHNRLLETFRRAKRFTDEAGKNAVDRQTGWMRLLNQNELDTLLGPRHGAPTPRDLVADLRGKSRSSDPVNRMLETDTALGLEGDMLVKVDRMSMANGLEVRCPFLDHRVVDFGQRLPSHLKLRKGRGKYIFKLAFGDRLPQELFERPKKGFEMPIAEWLLGDLNDRLRSAIDRATKRPGGYLNRQCLDDWLLQLRNGRRDTSWRLWTVLAFEGWMSSHGSALGVVDDP